MREERLTMWIPLLVVATIGGIALSEDPPVNDIEFMAGQVWSYHTRAHEKGSRLHIVRVDRFPEGEAIYHIYVDGLAIRNPRIPSGVQDSLPYAPVSAVALRASVVSLLEHRESQPPDISGGYSDWREAFDKGEGGYFTIPVAKIIDHLESVLTDD